MNLPPTEKIILRDAKTKLISFELLSISRFSLTTNFNLPQEILALVK
jgi:hypothetical protein